MTNYLLDTNHASPLVTIKHLLIIVAFVVGSVVAIKETVQQVTLAGMPKPEEIAPVPPYLPKPDEPSPENDPLITFLHLTTVDSAQQILAVGIQPHVGARSGNDVRFFALTQESGPLPRPTDADITDMLSFVATLLESSHAGEKKELVFVKIPQAVVLSLEKVKFIHYGPFLPNSSDPGLTESIFEVDSFPIVNQYRHLWVAVPVN